MTQYYTFRKFVVEAYGQEVIVVGKAGAWSWNELNPGTAALLESAIFRPNDHVLDLGCGTGVIGAVASVRSPRGRVTLVDCNTVAVECARRTLKQNALANAEVQLGDGVTDLAPSSFDLVLSHLPRGRAVQEPLIQGAAWVLRPGGRFYLVAHKQAGVKGAVDHAQAIFGRCGVIRQKKGYHVAMTVKPEDLEVPAPVANVQEQYVTHSLTLEDIEATLVSKPGVFAWDRLDDGTATLIDAMEIRPGDRVLDLGCGTGLVGLIATRRAPDTFVTLVDADIRAVESARRTLAVNGVPNAEVLLSDCGSAVFDRTFDVVVTNPPFHQDIDVDYEVASQFVRDAARLLHTGGRFFLVANRFLKYGDLIRQAFGNVDTHYADNRYHVLTAVA